MTTATDQLLEDLADKVDALTEAKAVVANLQIEVARAAARLVVGTCVLPPPAAPAPQAAPAPAEAAPALAPPAPSPPATPAAASTACGNHHPVAWEVQCALDAGHGGQHANEEGDVFWGGPKPGPKSPARRGRAKPKKAPKPAKGARKRPRAGARPRRRAPAPPAEPTPSPRRRRAPAVEPASSALFGGSGASGGEPPTIRRAILDLIAERGPMTAADVMKALGGNAGSTRRTICKLEQAGELERGLGVGAPYSLPGGGG
jgi:hypothetical protein